MKVYSVTEFRAELNELLGEVTVAVEGEVTDFNISQNRFVWFSLADEQTLVKCFMLTFQLKVPLEEGMQIRAVGSPTLFKKGQMVFRPRTIELVGDGSLKQAYELLKKKLDGEGLFDEDRKRSIPRFPTRIGLITSRDAAAYTDVLRILNNRWSGLEIVHAHVNVQGTNAVNSIVGALQQINEEESELDCVILTRGGGSMEDLAAFNSEEVARAIFASNIPVVCGVGHERDTTIADYVADVRASTPSNAAEMVAPHKDDVTAEIQHMMSGMEQRLHRHVQQQRFQVNDAVNVLEGYARNQVDQFRELKQRLYSELDKFQFSVVSRSERLHSLKQLLQSYHPLKVLDRGYTITRDAEGNIIRPTSKIQSGDKIQTQLSSKTIDSIVE